MKRSMISRIEWDGKSGRNRMVRRLAAGSLLLVSLAGAQGFTKEDSGWVPLFNGKDFAGLYSRMYNAPVTNAPDINAAFRIDYPGTDSVEIRVAAAGGTIGTQRTSYAHYRVRIQYRFETVGSLNAGLLYHVDETYPRMGGDGTIAKGNWPRGIECQMKQGEGGDAFSIQQAAFDTKVNGNAWNVNGKAIKVCEFGCDGRSFIASPRMDKPTDWNSMEAIVRGPDSAIHFLNGPSVFKLWNIRLADKTGATLSPWGSGAIGLEAENAVVHYRRWEVMELPKTGPHFLNRLFLSTPLPGEKIAAQSTYSVKWRQIGDFKKAFLEYDTGSGWKSVGDSVDNTGSYPWKIPNEPSKTLRLRISGPSYVRADSSRGNSEITASTGLTPRAPQRFFTFAGRSIPLDGIGPGAVLTIQDVSGRVVRALPIGADGPQWDLKDARGERVRPGLYFARFAGTGGVAILRAWVF